MILDRRNFSSLRRSLYSQFNTHNSRSWVNQVSRINFDYFPNPVVDELVIQSAAKITSVEIFNLIGKRVLNFENVSSEKINLNALTSGTYLGKVTFEGNLVETIKIIKK